MSALEQNSSPAKTALDQVGGIYQATPASVHDGDAVRMLCDVKGAVMTHDINKATDDAAAPTVGPLVMGKFGASSPDANDAAPIRCGSTGEVIVDALNKATDDAAAPTSGPMVLGRYQVAEDTVNDGDAAPLRVDSAGKLIVVQGTAADLNCTEASGTATKTAVEIMDDWDEVHSAACGTDGALVMGYASTTAPAAVTDADAARVWLDARGRVNVRECYSYAQGSGDYQVSANPCYVKRVILSATSAGVVTVYDNAAEAGTAVLKFYMAANTTAIIPLETIFATACYVGKDGAWAGECTVCYENLA